MVAQNSQENPSQTGETSKIDNIQTTKKFTATESESDARQSIYISELNGRINAMAAAVSSEAKDQRDPHIKTHQTTLDQVGHA